VRASGAAVDVALLGISALAAVVLIALPGELRDRTAATLRRTAVAPLVELQRVAEVQRAKYLSYDERVAQRATLARDAADVTGLRAENDRLRRTLGLGARLRWGFVAAEAIPTQSAGELARQPILLSFMLTQGSRAGVAPFAPVVAPEGLVGMVHQTDAATSIAITYANADFRVSAQTPDGAAYGIVQPHLGSGAERALLEIRGVAFRSPLKPGQLVVSSGQGGTYPPGIPVGTVIREIQTPERWARTYLIEPAVRLSDVGAVVVLRKQRSVAGVDSVWTSLASADSAARRVAAAGDSIARDALLREAAARRAAFDSTRPDSAARDSLPAAPTAPVSPAAPTGAPGATASPNAAPPAAVGVVPPRTTDSAAPRPAAPRAAPPARPAAPRPEPAAPAAAPGATPPPARDSAAGEVAARRTAAARPSARRAGTTEERTPERAPERAPEPSAEQSTDDRPAVRPTVPAPTTARPSTRSGAATTARGDSVRRDSVRRAAARAAARRARTPAARPTPRRPSGEAGDRRPD
jgi:cell shape-determining protein MreC